MALLPAQGEATRLLLVRHAATDPSFAGRCYGRLDVGLSPEGTRQADALAAALADVPLAAVYSSPLARAVATAAPLATARGLETVLDERLRELDFGELEGLSYEDVSATRPELFRAWMESPTSVRFPGGEGFADLRARVLAAAAEIRQRHEGEAVAVVAHGGVIRVVLADALGLEDGAVFRLGQSHGGVSVVDWVAGAPVVPLVNAVLYSRA
jgi:alpha-ribazole phosphatase/probable phosphoglycerate mutase